MAKLFHMGSQVTNQYWLFQSNPAVFRLQEALKAGVLSSFAVTAHKSRIHKGDKVILWQSGKNAGCYGLATVLSEVGDLPLSPEEADYFLNDPPESPRVQLQVDFNLWNNPITREVFPGNRSLDRFYAGLPGTNYKATARQYRELESLIKQWDAVQEPEVEYQLWNSLHHSLNTIFYGPPGTGKTYQTINYALSIIEKRSLDELALEDRQELRRRFNEYLGQGQTAFITFHQAFTYEDFVEGIKPVTQKGQISYQVEDGLFKLICMDARRCLFEALMQEAPLPEYKLDFNRLYRAFLEYLKGEEFNYFTTGSKKKIFFHQVLRYGNLSVRPAKSFAVQTILRNRLRKLYQHYPTADEITDAGQIRQILGNDSTSAYWGVFRELKQFELAYQVALASMEETPEAPAHFEFPVVPDRVLAKCRKYVLIIDEINRGNIPAIFGDLISLIEEDKREGRPEALMSILPYSKSFFAVPPNLYIIGTMNTADRSTEMLDLALRRRFRFVEMPPNPALIGAQSGPPTTLGVDLEKMLIAINSRIEMLLNADFCLGHAYFLAVRNLLDLQQIFAGRIIPLLQEYFFDDLGKIGLVLGKDFVRIKNQPNRKTHFADFAHPISGEFRERVTYDFVPVHELEAGAFIRIYDPEYTS